MIDHILEYDPEDGTTSLDSSSAQPAFMAPRTLPDIPWPKGLNPVPKPFAKAPDANAALPRADVIVVTWTVAEALALSDVLTPGYRSKTDWYRYRHNWAGKYKGNLKHGAPALKEDRLGLWFRSQIGGKKLICFKSELHMARDGARLPLKELWLQLIQEVNPSIIITTGTAGGIGGAIELGDVIVSRQARFVCKRTFKNFPFNNRVYTGKKPVPPGRIAWANRKLMGVTASRLPGASHAARILRRPITGISPIDIVTTDFFAFDDDTNFFHLQGLGSAVEMGDASLGLACSQLGNNAPAWIAIRNASDPQIGGPSSIQSKADKAARIYEKYGYWTTVNSAIACWAVVC
jgi:hypothetical protein